jgi:hypothetical protein
MKRPQQKLIEPSLMIGKSLMQSNRYRPSGKLHPKASFFGAAE